MNANLHSIPGETLSSRRGLSWVRQCATCDHFDLAPTPDDPFQCPECLERAHQHQLTERDDLTGSD